MANEQQESSIDRRKRVQFLKKAIVTGLVIGVTVPWALCAVLFFLAAGIKNEAKAERQENRSQMEAMEQELRRQEEQIAQLNSQLSEFIAQMETERQEAIVPDLDASVSGEEEKSTGHKVYLTFDDGPSKYTNDILDILKKYGVKATFFVLGKPGKGNEAALNRIVEEGHTLGMHSYSHKYSEIYATKESFIEDFQGIQTFLEEVTGVTSKLYRFPGGSSNTVTAVDIHEFIGYLQEQDVVYYDWNVSSGDAASQTLSVEAIYENCIEGIVGKSVSVVLFHDAADKKTTVEALPKIIETLLKMEDTEILPITEESKPVQHVKAEVIEN